MEYLKSLYVKLRKPVEITYLDFIAIYSGLAILFLTHN